MSRWAVERMVLERDLDAIVAIEAESFTNPWTRDMFLWEAEHSDVSRVFVARDETGRVVAYCSTWLVFDELHINNLAVHPSARGRGLGAMLLSAVLEEAASQGARRATLEVRESNTAARRLYERAGFVVTATRRDYYTNPRENALILWRDLAPVTS